MDRHIRAEDVNGAPVFHAIEYAPGRWHWTGPDHSGVYIADYEHVITRLADLIGEGKVSFLIACGPRVPIDRAGNTWLGHQYLAPHQYLPLLIPETAPE